MQNDRVWWDQTIRIKMQYPWHALDYNNYCCQPFPMQPFFQAHPTIVLPQKSTCVDCTVCGTICGHFLPREMRHQWGKSGGFHCTLPRCFQRKKIELGSGAPISIPCDSFFTTFRYRHHKKAMARRQMVFYVFLLPIQLVKWCTLAYRRQNYLAGKIRAATTDDTKKEARLKYSLMPSWCISLMIGFASVWCMIYL